MKRNKIVYKFDRDNTMADIQQYYEDQFLLGYIDEEEMDKNTAYMQELNAGDDEFIINEAKDLGFDIRYVEKGDEYDRSATVID